MEGNGFRATAQRALANRPSSLPTRRANRANNRRPSPLANTRNNRRTNRPVVNTAAAPASAAAVAPAGAAGAAAGTVSSNTRLLTIPPLPLSPPRTLMETAERAGSVYGANKTDRIMYTNLKTGKRYKLLDANPRLGEKINALLEELRVMKARGEPLDDDGFIRYLVLLITEELSS